MECGVHDCLRINENEIFITIILVSWKLFYSTARTKILVYDLRRTNVLYGVCKIPFGAIITTLIRPYVWVTMVILLAHVRQFNNKFSSPS